MSGSQRDVTFRFLAEPTDVNFGGKVHGGAVMKWIDQAGYACAAGWAGRYCVTVYVGGIQFERPIQVGQIVEVHAQIVHTGSTSMHVAVDVAARDATADDADASTSRGRTPQLSRSFPIRHDVPAAVICRSRFATPLQ